MSRNNNVKRNAKEAIAIVGVVADDAQKAIRKGGQRAVDIAKQTKEELDRKRLNPFFIESLSDPNFQAPKMIRIMEPDSQHLNNPVCDGSIGYGSEAKGMQILNLYTSSVSEYGATFYPTTQEGVYYADPCHPNFFINLNDYFYYLKKVRVDELNRIAQDLGASYIKISLTAEKRLFLN